MDKDRSYKHYEQEVNKYRLSLLGKYIWEGIYLALFGSFVISLIISSLVWCIHFNDYTSFSVEKIFSVKSITIFCNAGFCTFSFLFFVMLLVSFEMLKYPKKADYMDFILKNFPDVDAINELLPQEWKNKDIRVISTNPEIGIRKIAIHIGSQLPHEYKWIRYRAKCFVIYAALTIKSNQKKAYLYNFTAFLKGIEIQGDYVTCIAALIPAESNTIQKENLNCLEIEENEEKYYMIYKIYYDKIFSGVPSLLQRFSINKFLENYKNVLKYFEELRIDRYM